MRLIAAANSSALSLPYLITCITYTNFDEKHLRTAHSMFIPLVLVHFTLHSHPPGYSIHTAVIGNSWIPKIPELCPLSNN
jgi:hypothetical protein